MNKQRRSAASGGFTLVEMMVVLLILGLIGVLAVPVFAGWVFEGQARQRNDQARLIYMAAQTRLTQYEEQGQLTALNQLLTGEGGTRPAPADSFVVPDHVAVERRIYMKAAKGDYRRYQALAGMSPAAIRELPYQKQQLIALFDLIDPLITDKTILKDAAICIELDPDPAKALVYAVFYMDGSEGQTFSYDQETDDSEVTLADRNYQTLKDKQVGYFGTEIK